jgi:hypothetical protein
MSIEPDNTSDTTTDDDNTPVTPPPVEDETRPEDPTPPTPAPDTPDTPITFEPATWYEVTSACVTADTGDGTPCPNLNTTTTEPLVYSNAGTVIMICGLCGKRRTILAATKLDPQPEMS